MNVKRIIISIFALLLAISLVACNADDPVVTDADTDTSIADILADAESSDTTKEIKEIKERNYNLSEILDSIKTFGRTSVQGSALACDHVASGIEFNAYVEGKLNIEVTASKGEADGRADDCYFTVYIDGVRSENRLKAAASSTTTLELADFETGGVHNVRLIKQTEPMNAISTLNTLSFTGYLEDKPVDSSLYIEFLGDSITAGYGNLVLNGASNPHNAANQDASQAFAYLTAQNLGADHSILSASGIGVYKGYRAFTMSQFYDVNSYYRSQTTKFLPQRTPDLVVINLGTNDENNGVSLPNYKQAVYDLIMQVRMTYGENVRIVWVYGMMKSGDSFPSQVRAAIDMIGGNDTGVYMCQLEKNTQGGNGHPNLQAQASAAQQLAKFITENVLK